MRQGQQAIEMMYGEVIRRSVGRQSDGTMWVSYNGTIYIVEVAGERKLLSNQSKTEKIYKCLGEAKMEVMP